MSNTGHPAAHSPESNAVKRHNWLKTELQCSPSRRVSVESYRKWIEQENSGSGSRHTIDKVAEDVAALEKGWEPVQLVYSGREWSIVWRAFKPTWLKLLDESEAKCAIAAFVAGVVFGRDTTAGLAVGFEAGPRLKIPDTGLIRQELNRHQGSNPGRARLIHQLEEFWTKPHRSVFVDAGSTAFRVIEALIQLPLLSDSGGSFLRLDVFTNNPTAQLLGERLPPHIRLCFLGGYLQRDPDAITGELTRTCLEKWDIHCDLAIMGASNIDQHLGKVSCVTADEALTKATILKSARMTCLATDVQKVHGWNASFLFGNLANFDLLVTNQAGSTNEWRQLSSFGPAVVTCRGEPHGAPAAV